MTDIWKDIPDLDGYRISLKGEVGCFDRRDDGSYRDTPIKLLIPNDKNEITFYVNGKKLCRSARKLYFSIWGRPCKGTDCNEYTYCWRCGHNPVVAAERNKRIADEEMEEVNGCLTLRIRSEE